jgi:predicted Fe-Mo cluster-binding NifX family protein
MEVALARGLLPQPSMAATVLAIPLFGDEVAPRFCSADVVLIVELEDGVERSRHRIKVGDSERSDLIHRLAQLKVAVLLCGGLGRRFMLNAERRGIEIEADLTGKADALIKAFIANDLERFRLSRQHRSPALPKQVLTERQEPRRQES